MRVRHRIVFRKNTVSNKFITFLIKKGAVFKETNTVYTIAYVFESDDSIDELNWYYRKEGIVTPLIDAVYTKAEFDKAKWLSIRSKFRFEYPQPEDDFTYKKYTYDNNNGCGSCGCGLVQKESFRVNKAPKWGKRHFLMLNWVEDELFVNTLAKDCINIKDIRGFRYLDVINHKKNTKFDDFYQMYVEKILDPGMTNLEQSVKLVRKCDTCNSVKYICTGRGISFKKEVFENIDTDIIKSYERFGDGHMCASEIIVSKKLFDMIKSNNLDKDLVFEPITLV
ncbi:MAG: hypothetical protein VB009_04945 [Erysipelotrichaceae bacterium]|nr:hypothetical protein [Erysipelotrichaceae bacterium]